MSVFDERLFRSSTHFIHCSLDYGYGGSPWFVQWLNSFSLMYICFGFKCKTLQQWKICRLNTILSYLIIFHIVKAQKQNMPKLRTFLSKVVLHLKCLDFYNWLYGFGGREVSGVAHAVCFIMLIRQVKATLVVGQEDNIVQVNCCMKAKCTCDEKCVSFFLSKFHASSRCRWLAGILYFHVTYSRMSGKASGCAAPTLRCSGRVLL